MKEKLLPILFALLAFPLLSLADDTITADQIRAVIAAVDEAAMNRDTQGIGKYLSENFTKDIEIDAEGSAYTAHVAKKTYLQMIEAGWKKAEKYSYTRQDTTINIAEDGTSGESNSTITETLVADGKEMVSKIREYAHYQIEDGRVVITTVEGHTLVGDTTPQ